MGTSLGDATIRVALDPSLAKDELERLSQEIEKIDKAKQEESKKIDDLDQKSKDSGDAAKRAAGRGGAAGGGAMQSIKDIIDSIAGPAQKAAQVGEYLLPKIGTALQSSLEGTIFEKIGHAVDASIQMLADQITTVRANLDSIKPFADQAVQYNIAALRLGGRFPEDQQELMKQLWQITNQQEMLRRNLNRDIDNQTIDSIFKGAKALMSGGK